LKSLLKIKIYFQIRNPGFFLANFDHLAAVLCWDFSRDPMVARGHFMPGFFLASRAATQSTPERPVGCGEGGKTIRGVAKVGRGEGSTFLNWMKMLEEFSRPPQSALEMGKGKNN